MSYVYGKYAEAKEAEVYRDYTAETLKSINDTLAQQFGGKVYPSLHELLNPAPVDERTAEEIIEHVRQGLSKLGGS